MGSERSGGISQQGREKFAGIERTLKEEFSFTNTYPISLRKKAKCTRLLCSHWLAERSIGAMDR